MNNEASRAASKVADRALRQAARLAADPRRVPVRPAGAAEIRNTGLRRKERSARAASADMGTADRPEARRHVEAGASVEEAGVAAGTGKRLVA